MTQLFYTSVKRSYQSLDRFYTPVKPTMFEINVGALVQRVGFSRVFQVYTPVKPTMFEIERRCN